LSRLLVAQAEHAARIPDYSGRGSLRSWLRVIATRMSVDDARREDAAERAHVGAAAMPHALDAVDPELAYLEAHYRDAFQQSFVVAWTGLEPRERNLLRHQLLDGLSATQVAKLYDVHRATAKRWMADARASLLEGTRKTLRARLQVDTRDLDSVLRLVESRIEITARVYLLTADHP
jgi:RNA polymerase sigma-70 factor (ECF subfamily)